MKLKIQNLVQFNIIMKSYSQSVLIFHKKTVPIWGIKLPSLGWQRHRGIFVHTTLSPGLQFNRKTHPNIRTKALHFRYNEWMPHKQAYDYYARQKKIKMEARRRVGDWGWALWYNTLANTFGYKNLLYIVTGFFFPSSVYLNWIDIQWLLAW